MIYRIDENPEASSQRYLIFFRVDRRQVVVVRILNGAMDLDPLLS